MYKPSSHARQPRWICSLQSSEATNSNKRQTKESRLFDTNHATDGLLQDMITNPLTTASLVPGIQHFILVAVHHNDKDIATEIP
jgi:hypothetical protein